MLKFKEWLLKEDGQRTAAKRGNYPPAYGWDLYPPGAYMANAADATAYMDDKESDYHVQSKENIRLLPNVNGEGEYPHYKIPEDRSKQTKNIIPADSSTQPERYIP